MGFLGVCRALYDYAPQAAAELAITEGDLLYILEKGDEDDWWKAKKKAGADDEDEPEGLIPNNYVEEVRCPAFHVVQPLPNLADKKCSRPNPSPLPEPSTNTPGKPTKNSPSQRMPPYKSMI